MRHSDFLIGMTFFTAAGAWRCADIGTRVIVAISLEPRINVRSKRNENGKQYLRKASPQDLRK